MKALSIRVLESVKQHSVLAGILVVGFLLRITGVFWGTPFLNPFEGYYHPDEWAVIEGAIRFPQHVVENLRLVYPTFFHYFLGIIAFPLRNFFDDLSVPSLDAIGSNYYWTVTVLGRLCSVLAGTGAILLTYLLAKDIFEQRRALLASAFLALTMFHAANSAVATTDVLTSFFLVLFLLVLRRAFLQPEAASFFVYSGIAFGLLVGSKYTAAVAGCAFVVMYGYTVVQQFCHQDPKLQFDQRTFHRNLVLGVGATLVTFFLTTPGILLHFDALTDSVSHVAASLGTKSRPRAETQTWLIVLTRLVNAVGWPLATVFLFGLFFPHKKNVYEWSFLAILVVFFVYFEAKIASRYIILVAPLIAIIASHVVWWIVESRPRPFNILGLSMMAVVLVYSFGYTATGVSMRLSDTRTQAGEYIHHMFPSGTTLGVAYKSNARHWKNARWKVPRIDFVKYREMQFFDYPEVVVVSSLFGLKRIQKRFMSETLSEEIVSNSQYPNQGNRTSSLSPILRFYHELFHADRSPYLLLKTFERVDSVPVEFRSPEINIYVRRFYGPHTARRSLYATNPRQYFNTQDTRKWRWQVLAQPGNKADLVFPPEEPEVVRIAITRANTGVPWHIQLNQVPVEIKANHTYVIRFRARADHPRPMGIAIGQAYAPWQNLGLDQEMALTAEWQDYHIEFMATADEAQARVLFKLGARAVPVEITAGTLERKAELVSESLRSPHIFLSGARSQERSSDTTSFIEPDLPDKYYVDYRFNALGCRGRDYPIPRSEDGTRILVLGDSLALGAGVHEADTLASQLERLLNQKERTNSPKIVHEVINCGVGGSGTRDEQIFYEKLVSKYEPNLILLVVAPDDDRSWIGDAQRGVFDHLGESPKKFVSWSDQQESLFQRSSPDYSGSLQAIDDLHQLVQDRGAHLAVVLFRHTKHQAWNSLVTQITEGLQDTAVPVWDLGPALRRNHSEHDLTVNEVDKHPNEIAHKIAAETILSALKAPNVFSPPDGLPNQKE